MNSPDYNCGDCAHAYDGADGHLRCRVHSSGLKCSPAAYQDCNRFEREPGADSSESPWFKGGWCVTSSVEGRGD